MYIYQYLPKAFLMESSSESNLSVTESNLSVTESNLSITESNLSITESNLSIIELLSETNTSITDSLYETNNSITESYEPPSECQDYIFVYFFPKTENLNWPLTKYLYIEHIERKNTLIDNDEDYKTVRNYEKWFIFVMIRTQSITVGQIMNLKINFKIIYFSILFINKYHSYIFDLFIIMNYLLSISRNHT